MFRFAAPGGRMIVKHQMGLTEDVIVDTFSQELRQNYYSEYRSLENETALVSSAGFDDLRTTDIYPDSFNRWGNTRFMAITALKPE
jgi:hypothetical protein